MDLSNLKPTDRLDRHQAAEYLGTTYSTLACWVTRRRGPAYYRAGKKCLYRVADLDAFLETKRFKSEQVPQ